MISNTASITQLLSGPSILIGATEHVIDRRHSLNGPVSRALMIRQLFFYRPQEKEAISRLRTQVNCVSA